LTTDLVSYSAYDTQQDATKFRAALDFIDSQINDPGIGGRRVYIGEYGLSENEVSTSLFQNTIKNVVNTALAWGAPYAIYWELYSNEYNTGTSDPNDLRGFWLIRPDGTKAWNYGYFQTKLAGGPPQVGLLSFNNGASMSGGRIRLTDGDNFE